MRAVLQTAVALPLEAMYAAGFFQQRADGSHRLLTQQVGAECVSGRLCQQAAERVRHAVAQSFQVVSALSLHSVSQRQHFLEEVLGTHQAAFATRHTCDCLVDSKSFRRGSVRSSVSANPDADMQMLR